MEEEKMEEKKIDDIDEQAIILKMLHEGKLTREEAEMLLDALDSIEESKMDGAAESAKPSDEDKGRDELKEFPKHKFQDFGKGFQGAMKKMKDYFEDMSDFSDIGAFFLGREKQHDERIYSFTTDGIDTFRVRNLAGDIRIAGEERPDISVIAKITVSHPKEEGCTFLLDNIEILSNIENGTLDVFAKCSDEKISGSWHVSYEILIPENLKAAAESLSGDIQVMDLKNDVSMKTHSGDIDGENISGGTLSLTTKSGDIDLENISGALTCSSLSGDVDIENSSCVLNVVTASGDVSIEDNQGGIAVNSASGDVQVTNISGNLACESKSGDISAKQCVSEQSSIKTISGDQDIELLVENGFKVDCKSVSGDISCELPEEINAVAEIKSVSGSISCDYEVFDGSTTEHRLSGTLGTRRNGDESEKGAIRITTTSGDIDLGII